jgi:hypothetical protein
MPLILRLNERVEYVDDPEDPIRIRVGVVTEVLPWTGFKKGATYRIRFDEECVGEFRTDNDRDYLCRLLEVGEKVIFRGEDGGTSRSGEVIDVVPWTPEKRRKCVAYKVTVRFEDNGAEKEFFTGQDVHFLHSVVGPIG